MAFDDYNYTAFNQHVLVVQPEDSSKALDEMEQRLSLNKGGGADGQSERKELTNTDLHYIDQTSKPFTQDAITLPLTKFEMDKEQEPIEEQKPAAAVEKQKEKNQSEDESDKEKSAQGTEKREREAEDKYKDFMYNMYFEPSEIDKI